MRESVTDGKQAEIPSQVLDILKNERIGYLSVNSPKGDLYSYPVAFYFSNYNTYFMTPISAAKLKFVRAHPEVSFLVDNHSVTTNACGAMMQGTAKVFSITKTVLGILSVGPKMVQFSKKYPGMFTFYLKGKELPDERKLYKYRLIKITPAKVIYWTGYKFGKYIPKGMGSDPLSEASDEEKMETLANLMKSADEELPVPKVEKSQEWVESLDNATEAGVISRDERATFNSYRDFLRSAMDSSKIGPNVTVSERRLLDKWKKKPAS